MWHPQNRRPGRPGHPGTCPQRAKPDPEPQSRQRAARSRSRPHFHSRSRSPGTGPGPSPPAAPCGPALPPPGAGRGARRGAASALALFHSALFLLLLLVLRRRCPGSCPLSPGRCAGGAFPARSSAAAASSDRGVHVRVDQQYQHRRSKAFLQQSFSDKYFIASNSKGYVNMAKKSESS